MNPTVWVPLAPPVSDRTGALAEPVTPGIAPPPVPPGRDRRRPYALEIRESGPGSHVFRRVAEISGQPRTDLGPILGWHSIERA